MSAVELFLFTLTNLSIDNSDYTKYEIPYVSHDDYSEYKEQKQISVTKEYISVMKTENDIEEVKNYVVKEETIEFKDETEMSEELSNLLQENIETVQLETKEEVNKEESKGIDIKIEEEINKETIILENNNVEETKKIIEEKQDKKYLDVSGKEIKGDIKIIDVSYHQGKIDWQKFKEESNCYGVILRIGYYNYLDTSFKYNLSELKRLNIPYGIYLFSYAKNEAEALMESNFVYEKIKEYDVSPNLGIYYDIESWRTNKKDSSKITSDGYKSIISTFIDNLSKKLENKYKVKIYCNRWYATTKLKGLENYIDWVAEYNKTCKYKGDYTMWQYTSKGSIPGITGNVDISYLIKKEDG